MMVISQGAMSAGLIGLPRRGLSAADAPAEATAISDAARSAILHIDMFDPSLRIHSPTRDGIEMLAWEIQHRRWFRRLPTQRDKLGASRLHGAAFVPGAALQDCRSAAPTPWHAKARKG